MKGPTLLTPRLQIKQSQKLMMNPQMQQAIQLLQLTNMQLNDMLAQEIEQNPFLAFDAADYRAAAPPKSVPKPDAGAKDPPLRDTISVRELSLQPGQSLADSGDDYLAQLAAPEAGLSTFLLQQIRLSALSGATLLLAVELVGWLDDDGYLRDSDAELCASLGCDLPTLQHALTVLRGLEPSGVFARNLPDCLALQLQAQEKYTPAYAHLLANLGLMARGELQKLAALCAVSSAELGQMLTHVQALDPRPAASFDTTPELIRAPDILVRQEGDLWRAYLNEDNLPAVLVLERDWEEMANRKMTDKEKRFMKSNVQSARWLRKATQQRAATMLRVARAVVEYQQGFFSQGMEALKPMVLRDIADKLELHESTVSRVVAAKIVQTPSGQLALKDLFSVALSGGDQQQHNRQIVSAASIKARLARYIAAERAEAILSDEKLAEMLAEEGIMVARRTVAKYREGLKIASSAVRRRAAKLRAG